MFDHFLPVDYFDRAYSGTARSDTERFDAGYFDASRSDTAHFDVAYSDTACMNSVDRFDSAPDDSSSQKPPFSDINA